MVAIAIVLKFPDWQSNVHFPWPNELTICPDNGFQTFTTAILSTYLLHEYPQCKVQNGLIFSFNFLKQYSTNGTCLTSVNMSPSSHFFERVKFSWLVYLSLTGKRINFLGIATMSHINIQRRSEMLMFFVNNRIESKSATNRSHMWLDFWLCA